MIGRTKDRFRREAIAVVVLFGGNREEETQMFAKRQWPIGIVSQQMAQPGGRNELKAQMRLTFFQQAALQGVRVAA
jgi:hypothetical protein